MKKKCLTREQAAYPKRCSRRIWWAPMTFTPAAFESEGSRWRCGCSVMASWKGEGGSVCLHPSISAAEIKVLRFLAGRMRNLVSTLLAVYAFVSARLGNTEPETETRASPSDARRDKPPRSPRQSASAPAAPHLWPTPRDLRARNPLSQNAVRTPQNANAPAVGPGRSLLTVGRASFARAS